MDLGPLNKSARVRVVAGWNSCTVDLNLAPAVADGDKCEIWISWLKNHGQSGCTSDDPDHETLAWAYYAYP